MGRQTGRPPARHVGMQECHYLRLLVKRWKIIFCQCLGIISEFMMSDIHYRKLFAGLPHQCPMQINTDQCRSMPMPRSGNWSERNWLELIGIERIGIEPIEPYFGSMPAFWSMQSCIWNLPNYSWHDKLQRGIIKNSLLSNLDSGWWGTSFLTFPW